MKYFAHAAWLREQAEYFGEAAAFALPFVTGSTAGSTRAQVSRARTSEQIYRNARVAAHFGARAIKAQNLGELEREIIEWRQTCEVRP